MKHLLFILSLFLCLASIVAGVSACRSGPVPSEAEGKKQGQSQTGGRTAQTLPADGAGENAESLGEGIPLRDKGSSSQKNDQRKAIENDLIYGSPSSIAEAFDLISTARLPARDMRDYAWIAAGICRLIYPEMADSMIPPELRTSDNQPGSPLCRILADVQKGRIPQLPSQPGPLGTLLSGLTMFSTASADAVRFSLAALDSFDSMDSLSVLPSLARGLAAEQDGDGKKAAAFYSESLDLSSDVWPAELGLARTWLAQSDAAKALELLSSMQDRDELKPLTAGRRFTDSLARALYLTGDYKRAAPLVDKALRDQPDDYPFMLIKADLLIRSGSCQQALTLLESYGANAPENRLYYCCRARTSAGLKNREDALKWAHLGLKASPDDPELLSLAAGLVFEQAAQAKEPQKKQLREEARGYALKTLKLAEKGEGGSSVLSRDAVSSASWLLMKDAVESYDWPSAELYLKRSGLQENCPPEDRALVCLVLRKNRDWKAALELSGAWYKKEPDSEEAILAYLGALIGSGQGKNAAELLSSRHLPDAGGSSAFRSDLCYYQSLLEKGEEGRLAQLRQSLIENADNEDSLVALFDIYFVRRDYTKAKFYLTQALSLDPSNPELLSRESQLQAVQPGQSGSPAAEKQPPRGQGRP